MAKKRKQRNVKQNVSMLFILPWPFPDCNEYPVFIVMATLLGLNLFYLYYKILRSDPGIYFLFFFTKFNKW